MLPPDSTKFWKVATSGIIFYDWDCIHAILDVWLSKNVSLLLIVWVIIFTLLFLSHDSFDDVSIRLVLAFPFCRPQKCSPNWFLVWKRSWWNALWQATSLFEFPWSNSYSILISVWTIYLMVVIASQLCYWNIWKDTMTVTDAEY